MMTAGDAELLASGSTFEPSIPESQRQEHNFEIAAAAHPGLPQRKARPPVITSSLRIEESDSRIPASSSTIKR